MPRILGIDFGSKKSGLSTTDPLQIIVSPLDSVLTADLEQYLVDYCKVEQVEKMVFGRPTHKDGNDTYLVADIKTFIERLKKRMPGMVFDFADETNSSIQAREIIFQSGASKTKRRDKMLIDKVSAVLILQKYLRHI